MLTRENLDNLRILLEAKLTEVKIREPRNKKRIRQLQYKLSSVQSLIDSNSEEELLKAGAPQIATSDDIVNIAGINSVRITKGEYNL